jgi:transcriptional regulator with XRE-family HTH domain
MAAKTRLRAARDTHGWSQGRLVHELTRRATARRLRVPTPESLKTEVSRWENDHKTPDETYRQLFREICGLTDDELGFTDQPAAALLVVSRPPVVPETVTPALVGNLRGVLDQFARTDHLIGPRHLLTAVQDQAAFVEQRCHVAKEPHRRELVEVAVRFAEFSGWLHQDAGDFKTAMFWTDRAMDYVQELGRDSAKSQSVIEV